MSAIGPVEEGSGHGPEQPARALPDAAPARADTFRGRLAAAARRHGHGIRRVLLVSCAVAAALFCVANALSGQGRSHSLPPPASGDVRDVTYRGLTLPADPTGRTFTLHIRITAAPGPAVTVQNIRHPFPALTTHTAPAPPFTVDEHRPRDVALTIAVPNCDAVPLDVRLPFLDVTLRNTDVIRKHTEVLDRAYATDVTDALRRICG
jgi:hypothetical protein